MACATQMAVAVLLTSMVLSPASALRIGPTVTGFMQPAEKQAGRDPAKDSFIEVLDEDARIYLWHRFLTSEECDYLRLKAEKRLERSGVVDSTTGGSSLSDIRTSDGMFFSRAEDAVIEAIERRLAEWTLTPVHYGEGLQVLRYKAAQKYDAHWDYFFDTQNTQNGGNRWSTVLMYLAEEIEEGGETVFPKLPAKGGVNPGFSDCARSALAVKPKKGDAILFHSMQQSGELEARSMHGACPVIKGEKWSMTKWIHEAHYRMGDKYDEQADAAADRVKQFQESHEKEL